MDDSHNEKPDVESGGAVAASGKTNGGKPKGKPRKARVTDDGVVVRGERHFERGDHTELRDWMLEDLRRMYTGAIVHDEGDLYQCDPNSGLWRIVTEQRQSELITSYAGTWVARDGKSLKIDVSNVKGAIALAAMKQKNEGFFAKAPDGLAFRNGFVAVEPKGLVMRGHVPDNRARWGYPFDYNPDLDCPLFKAFLGQMFAMDVDKAERIQFVLEWSGIALIGAAAKFGVALVLKGLGGQGKKVLSDILRGVFPDGSTTTVSPYDWHDDYSLAMLRGKLLNIVAEMPTKDFGETDRIKAVLTGDPLKARPIREKPFIFTPKAGNLWTTNNLPGTPDNSYAWARRFAVLELSNTVDPNTANVNLAAEILATEKQAIAALLLVNAQQALARGRLAIPPSSEARVREWIETGDSLSWFVNECCVKLTDNDPRKQWLTAEEFIEAYRGTAHKNGFSGLYNARNIKEKMQNMGLAQRRGGGGVRYPVRQRGMTDPYPDDGKDE